MIYLLLSELGFVGLVSFVFVLALFPPTMQKPAVRVALPAKRMVMLDNGLCGYITINNGVDHIAYISQNAKAEADDGRLSRLYPDVQRLPIINETWSPGLETLLLLHSDAVVAWAFTAQGAKDLNPYGVIGLFWKTGQRDPIGDREYIWRVYGKVSGHEDRVEYLLNKWAARRAVIKASIPQNPAQQAKVAWIKLDRGNWSTLAGPLAQFYRARLAGARSVGSGFASAMSDIVSRPEFRALRAVREKRFYREPMHAESNEPFEDLMLLTWMAQIFYPDAKLPRLRDEYKQQYWDVYHYAISDDEIDKIIYLNENSHSAGYERFSRQAGVH
jgi:iron complex transport system substrate-binding protein